jgi:hypothetical protein
MAHYIIPREAEKPHERGGYAESFNTRKGSTILSNPVSQWYLRGWGPLTRPAFPDEAPRGKGRT